MALLALVVLVFGMLLWASLSKEPEKPVVRRPIRPMRPGDSAREMQRQLRREEGFRRSLVARSRIGRF